MPYIFPIGKFCLFSMQRQTSSLHKEHFPQHHFICFESISIWCASQFSITVTSTWDNHLIKGKEFISAHSLGSSSPWGEPIAQVSVRALDGRAGEVESTRRANCSPVDFTSRFIMTDCLLYVYLHVCTHIYNHFFLATQRYILDFFP
jgi:hypothetical protein